MIARSCLAFVLLASPAAARDPASSGEEELPWSCQMDFPEAGTQLWVRKDLDERGGPPAYMVGFVASSPAHEDTRLEWVIPPSGDWFGRPYSVDLTFEFPSVPREGPVVANIYEDGILMAKQIVLSREWVASLDKTGRAGGSISYSTFASGGFPLRIHGTTELVAVAVGPDGRELTRARFPLPDWARVDRAVRDAVPKLDRDAEDYRHKCGQWGGEQTEPYVGERIRRPSS